MLMLSLFHALSALLPRLLKLATRLMAHALNVPEPLLHSTGVYVVVQVQAAEHRAARSLCPTRLARRFRSLCRRSAS